MYELEGHVRRGAAERGAAEIKQNEFQGEIQRQKDQIVQIENFYKKKLEDVQSTCSQEKVNTSIVLRWNYLRILGKYLESKTRILNSKTFEPL